jgi:hypothetical protein
MRQKTKYISRLFIEIVWSLITLLRDPIMGELSFLAFRLSDNILIGVGFSLVGSRFYLQEIRLTTLNTFYIKT